ncbi:hypothetical protein ACFL1X_14720, partial [Candidatus Hydrogenedentota bacterium]
VIDALRTTSGMTIDELMEETGVERKTIIRFLEEERITSDTVKSDVKCGKCGAPGISLTKKICAKCAAGLAKQARSSQNALRSRASRASRSVMSEITEQRRENK